MDLRTSNGSNTSSSSSTSSITSDFERESLLSTGALTVNPSDVEQNEVEHLEPNTSAAQASKAIDMAEDDTWIPATPSRPVSLLTARTNDSERVFLLDAGPAPPDYAQATAQQPFVASHPADSESLYSSSLVSQDLRKIPRWIAFFKRRWKSFLLLNMCIYCMITTVILVLRYTSRSQLGSRWVLLYPADHPKGEQNQPKNFHETTTFCHFTTYTGFKRISISDPKPFIFEETVRPPDHRRFGITSIIANVDIRPAPYGQMSPIEVFISFATTAAWRAGVPKLYTSTSAVKLGSSLSEGAVDVLSEQTGLERNSYNTNAACLSVWVGIYVRGPLDKVDVRTDNLNVNIGYSGHEKDRRWFMWTREQTAIYAQKGNVTASSWDTHNASVTTQTGSIKGTFALSHELDLHTIDGEIDIEAWRNTYWQFTSESDPPSPAIAKLSSFTHTGNQFIKFTQRMGGFSVADKLNFERPYIFKSRHYSDTGSISLDVSEFWEGRVHATSVNGSIDLEGESLEVLPDGIDSTSFGDKAVMRHVRAKKGRFDGSMTIETEEGNILLHVEGETNDFNNLPLHLDDL